MSFGFLGRCGLCWWLNFHPPHVGLMFGVIDGGFVVLNGMFDIDVPYD
ncbi:MAG: hypothetical protein ACE37E_16030 [Hyphomicrobiales bacterium]